MSQQLTPVPDLADALAAAQPGDRWLRVDGSEAEFKGQFVSGTWTFYHDNKTHWAAYRKDGTHAYATEPALAGPANRVGGAAINLPAGVSVVVPMGIDLPPPPPDAAMFVRPRAPACDHAVVDSGFKRAWCRCGQREYALTQTGWTITGERRA